MVGMTGAEAAGDLRSTPAGELHDRFVDWFPPPPERAASLAVTYLGHLGGLRVCLSAHPPHDLMRASDPGEINYSMPARRLTYEQIADDLAARIVAGEYPPHTHLPSQREIAALYSVSVATVEKVHILLRARGLTYGVPGRGVFVAERES